MAESCKHQNELDTLIKKVTESENVHPIDPYLARILITELLWGKGYLKPEHARAIRIILELESDLRSTLASMQFHPDNISPISGRLINIFFSFQL